MRGVDIYKETFPGSGEWVTDHEGNAKRLAERKAKREKRKQEVQPIDWDKILKICEQCDEYIKPGSQYKHGHCELAIEENKGRACEGCYNSYLKKCSKLKIS